MDEKKNYLKGDLLACLIVKIPNNLFIYIVDNPVSYIRRRINLIA